MGKQPKKQSKSATVTRMLSRDDGATVAEIPEAFGHPRDGRGS